MPPLWQVKGVSIVGHPIAAYNGVYTHDSTHEGWPVLKNASGRYCYRCTPRDQWLLAAPGYDPVKGTGTANIVAKEGPLPVGARTWQCWVRRKWVERTLTVALVLAE